MLASWKKNPWKAAVIVGAIATVALVAGRVVTAALNNDDEEPARERTASAAKPSPQAVEDCNQYARQAGRDNGRIVKDGLIGGAVGAGLGAAGGAIADGGSGAGKGAGIGALVGATAGALHGLTDENRKSDQARIAYRECMARRGYN